MTDFINEGDKVTPKILLSKSNNEFYITGTSRPENPKDFYSHVFNWLNTYFESPNDETVFQVQLDYFNTSTSKVLLDLFELFEEKVEDSINIKVVWQYKTDDEEMMEAGEELLDLVEIPYEIQEVE